MRSVGLLIALASVGCVVEDANEDSAGLCQGVQHDERDGKPLDCEFYDCGAVDSPLDEQGCLRQECEQLELCTEGFVCHAPEDHGGCVTSDLNCNGNQDDDCGGHYCIPAELAPPAG